MMTFGGRELLNPRRKNADIERGHRLPHDPRFDEGEQVVVEITVICSRSPLALRTMSIGPAACTAEMAPSDRTSSTWRPEPSMRLAGGTERSQVR